MKQFLDEIRAVSERVNDPNWHTADGKSAIVPLGSVRAMLTLLTYPTMAIQDFAKRLTRENIHYFETYSEAFGVATREISADEYPDFSIDTVARESHETKRWVIMYWKNGPYYPTLQNL